MSLQPEFYVDVAGDWRWRLTAANGETVGASTEGFASRQKAEENYQLVVRSNEPEADE